MSTLNEKTLHSEEIFSGKIISLHLQDVELPNGKQSKREIIKHPGAVAILAVTDDQKIVMVEQFRKALERTIVEIPAGKLEKGEEPVLCARRELEEETGYECESLELLVSFYTSPGFADEIVHLYVAKGLTKKENAATLDEDEFVNIEELTLDEAIQYIKEQKIYDAKTAYAVQYLQLQEALAKKMKRYYVDLHIHIGRTWTGKPVKITGAKSLTFTNIIEHARHEKGLNMVGIIDSHSPEVILEMESLVSSGDIVEHPDGGLAFGDLTVIPGSELEIYDEQCNGPIHVLCYFPTILIMKEFSNWLSNHLKNVQLSSQRIYVSGLELQRKVKEIGGIFIPAHVFTPFKSLYGKGVNKSLTEVFDPILIDGIELGLSSNTMMADQISELHNYTFVTNSDAHSLAKIAREYQVISMNEPSFKELGMALRREEGRQIIANYGLDPLLGKYHKTVCAKCLHPAHEEDQICTQCGKNQIVKGVADRILELKTADHSPEGRPPYVHQVPLDFIPGLGPKLLEKLVNHFGSEMAILHEVPYQALTEVVPPKIADLIMKAREGKVTLTAGGGGKYGKIAD